MSSIDCGRFIAELRKEKKITQLELANLLKVSNSAISRWETGEGYPDISIFPKLAETLNVSVDELLMGRRKTLEMGNVRRKTNMRFNNASFGSTVILIASFLLFIAITYSTYRVWYGVIGFIILSTGASLWFLLSRNVMLEECDYNDDDQFLIYRKTLLFYTMLITFSIMLIPQIVASISSPITTTVMAFDLYSILILIIGTVGIISFLVIKTIHMKKIHLNISRISNVLSTQDLIICCLLTVFLIFSVMFNGFLWNLTVWIPISVFTILSVYLWVTKKDSRKTFYLRMILPAFTLITFILIGITEYRDLSNSFLSIWSFIVYNILPVVVILLFIFVLVFCLINVIKKMKQQNFDHLYRLYRHLVMLCVALIFNLSIMLLLSSQNIVGSFVYVTFFLLIPIVSTGFLFIVVEHKMEKYVNDHDIQNDLNYEKP